MTAPYRDYTPRRPPPPQPPRLDRPEAQSAALGASRNLGEGSHYFEFPGVHEGRRGVWRATVEGTRSYGAFHVAGCAECTFEPAPPPLVLHRRAANLCLWLGFLG